jgi:hypothetical protein
LDWGQRVWEKMLRGDRPVSEKQRHVVPDVDRLLDCHRPEQGVGSFAPVDGCMQQHGMSNGHDGTDSLFGSTVLMVSTRARDPSVLVESRKVLGEGGRGKGTASICVVFLWNDAIVPACQLKFFFCTQHFFSGVV